MSEMPETELTTAVPDAPRRARWATPVAILLLLAGLVVWWLIYDRLGAFADWYTYKVMHYPRVPGESIKVLENCACLNTTIPEEQVTASMRQGRAVSFLLFQVPHTFMLLTLVVFLMGIVRSWFSAEGTRRLLAGKHPLTGRLLAAALGVVTPFCSCSAAPLFIGFVTAGVPLGATFTFLLAAPMVDWLAISVIFDAFKGSSQQWLITGIYTATGLTIAILTGWLVERLGMQRHVEEWVYAFTTSVDTKIEDRLTFTDRIQAGFVAVKEILSRVWLFALLGIIIGTILYAFISQQMLVKALGGEHWWSVPLAVLIGVPIYANPASIIPIVQALLLKGVGIGTVLALMMSVVGLSLPEFIILRKVLKPRLILLFAGVVSLGILIVGTTLNLLLSGRAPAP